MHTLRLISAFFKVNVEMALAYRVDTLVNILLEVSNLAWELISLNIIFSNTDTLAGWNLGELIALLGVLMTVNTFMSALIWPNTEKFNASVRDGSMTTVAGAWVPAGFVGTLVLRPFVLVGGRAAAARGRPGHRGQRRFDYSLRIELLP